jgi:O-antigen/teichoic acid export membrane protein
LRWSSLPGDTIRLGLIVCLGWVLNSLSATAESAVLGRVGGADGLGLYTKAMQIARYPVMIVFVPAFLPAVHRLSNRQDDQGSMGNELSRLLSAVLLLVSLPLGVLAGCARDFVPLVMGAQWTACVPLLLVMQAGVLGIPAAQAAMWGLTAGAQRKRMVEFQLVNALVPVGAIACGGWLAGAWGASVAFAAATWAILVPVGTFFSVRFAGVAPGRLIRTLGTVVVIALMTVLATRLGGELVGLFGGKGLSLSLIGGVLAGSVVWFVAARQIRRDSFREVVETLASGVGLDQKPWTRRFMDWCAPAPS